jgi:hypothetical protein
VYSIVVTPPTGVTDTSFISFDSTNRIVDWYTNDIAKTGIYTIEISGKITAKSIFTDTTSFTLTVSGSCATGLCATSTEMIKMT